METQEPTATGRVVIIGAGMSGLLAAAALRPHATEVVVVERDRLPDEPAFRGQVPQAQHAHGLLASGLTAMESLCPGLTADLVAAGCRVADVQNECRWVIGGHEVAPRSRPEGSGLWGTMPSRVLLETVVRRHVASMPGITLRTGCEVLGLDTGPGSAGRTEREVLGVRLRPVTGGHRDSAEVLQAALVVDSSGRRSQGVSWLEQLGCPEIPTERLRVDLAYTTREFVRGDMTLDGAYGVVVAPTADSPRGCAALSQEGERWIVTLAGFGGDRAPDDLEGFAAFADSLPSPWPARIIRECQPLGPARHFRLVESVRQRPSSRLHAPRGFVMAGDALCRFNPVYGQGMSVAALEAQLLGRLAANDLAGVAKSFYPAASALLDGPWDAAVTSDLALPCVPGPRPTRVRLVNGYLDLVARAAHSDGEVGTRLLRVLNLVDGPTALLSPTMLARVTAARRRPAPTRNDYAVQTA